MEKRKVPTLNEYTKLVKQMLKPMIPSASDDELDKYLKHPDSADEIKRNYDKSTREYDDGKITYDVLTNGCVGSVAYCLYMLY